MCACMATQYLKAITRDLNDQCLVWGRIIRALLHRCGSWGVCVCCRRVLGTSPRPTLKTFILWGLDPWSHCTWLPFLCGITYRLFLCQTNIIIIVNRNYNITMYNTPPTTVIFNVPPFDSSRFDSSIRGMCLHCQPSAWRSLSLNLCVARNIKQHIAW